MKDFLDWVFDITTDPIYSILFVLGCSVVGFGLFVAAVMLHPMLGFVAVLAALFGVPYAAYLKGRK
jgi:hypothetical protein